MSVLRWEWIGYFLASFLAGLAVLALAIAAELLLL